MKNIVTNGKNNTNFNLFFLLWCSLFIVTNGKNNTNFNKKEYIQHEIIIVTNSKIKLIYFFL